jgi:hypothetical protein
MQTEISTTEARQGKPVGAMRWVLGFGIAGAVAGLAIAGVLIGVYG